MAQVLAQFSKVRFSKQASKNIARGVVGAVALFLTLGAVASGRDLGQPGTSNQATSPNQVNVADASASSINRAAKTDRAVHPTSPVLQTRTVSLRLNDLANTSV